jgi:hypothetical protein
MAGKGNEQRREVVVVGSKTCVVLLGSVIGPFTERDVTSLLPRFIAGAIEIKVAAAFTRELSEDPRKRAGDSFDNYYVLIQYLVRNKYI